MLARVVHEITTPIAGDGSSLSPSTWEATLEKFHRRHNDLYAFDLRHRAIEMLSVTQDVVGVRPWSVQTRDGKSSGIENALKQRRNVCFERDGHARWIETPIYDGARLQSGDSLQGPAVVEETDTTIVLQPGDRAILNKFNVFDVAIDGAVGDAT